MKKILILAITCITTCITTFVFIRSILHIHPIHTSAHRESIPFNVTKTVASPNITLQISGRCAYPISHVGVDTRTSVLQDYDIHAKPTGGNRAPPTMNWARVILIREVLTICKNAKWIVYSDTDAYISHPMSLRYKLWLLPKSSCLVIQAGFWTVNSGFSAWRVNHCGLTLVEQWLSQYAKNNKRDYLGEQKGLLRIFKRNSKSVVQTRNGFLGWHMKGEGKYKTKLATIGRQFTRRTGPALFVVSLLCTACIILFHSKSPLYRLTNPYVCMTFASLYFIVNALVINAKVGGARRSFSSCSADSMSHVLPDGMVMIARNYWGDGDCYMVKGGLRFQFFRFINNRQRLQVFVFSFVSAIRWMALDYMYAALIIARLFLSARLRKMVINAVNTLNVRIVRFVKQIKSAFS